MANHRAEFGKYLKELREAHGYTSQRSLAEKTDISHSSIAKIERGANEASDETLHKLSKVFNIDYIELVEKQIAGNKKDTELLTEKIKSLSKTQIDMVNSIVDEFLRLGGRA